MHGTQDVHFAVPFFLDDSLFPLFLSHTRVHLTIFYFQLLSTRPRLLVEVKKLRSNNAASNFLWIPIVEGIQFYLFFNPEETKCLYGKVKNRLVAAYSKGKKRRIKLNEFYIKVMCRPSFKLCSNKGTEIELYLMAKLLIIVPCERLDFDNSLMWKSCSNRISTFDRFFQVDW